MNKSTKTEILPQNAHRLSLLQSLTHIKDHICEKTVLLVCFSLCCAAGGARCSPRGKVTHSDGSGQMRVYTPSVIAALQKHLASTDPELGGPLENLVQSSSQLNPSSDLSCPLLTCFVFFYTPRLQDVPPGRASSHWESRVLRGSIMAAVLEDSTAVRIDPATLAALQDTGWYTVNLSRAQSLVWGDGKWRWSQIKFKHIIHLISAWSLAWSQKILQTWSRQFESLQENKNVCFCRWRKLVWFLVNLSVLILFLHWQVFIMLIFIFYTKRVIVIVIFLRDSFFSVDLGVIIFTSTRGSARLINTWRDVECINPSRME